ncbi:uncharacterized protein LOC123880816 isoform X2 [Maniola jurtina]|uniref:uncharacterized protein LOC123880816 isoform X2 n=1 Tax=Maniola jurtina TaxID=191418 RepID=UPI001E68C77C|nr:uncharacterized protein LOC123880816 isoform X2 [Maniola jurtina]
MISETLYSNNTENHSHIDLHENSTSNMSESAEKSNVTWTNSATITLLKLYENKLEMLRTPKRKTRIWLAISESLRDYNFEMTADQVRWKINALTKKYKRCINTGQSIKFKYFKEMDDIHAKYNVDCDIFVLTEFIHKKNGDLNALIQTNSESKAMTKMRKVRLANRIESDLTQSKLKLEKQWLEYLNRQEQNRLLQDEVFDRNLRIREEELELRRQELVIKESLELRKLQLKEREQNELLKIEQEKCDTLKFLLDNRDVS